MDDYRLPRKGDRVRFWELGPDGLRRQADAIVVDVTDRSLWVTIDGRQGTFATPTREMQILDR